MLFRSLVLLTAVLGINVCAVAGHPEEMGTLSEEVITSEARRVCKEWADYEDSLVNLFRYNYDVDRIAREDCPEWAAYSDSIGASRTYSVSDIIRKLKEYRARDQHIFENSEVQAAAAKLVEALDNARVD